MELKEVDSSKAAFLRDSLRIEKEKAFILEQIPECCGSSEKIIKLFEHFSQIVEKILKANTANAARIEKGLIERERTISQIMDGSTVPAFVINKDHIVTHWNKALEKLSGYRAELIVGTRKHWMPFRIKKRPTMADVILDQFEEEEIRKYYGAKWRKSVLIEDAYEAEEFFPNLGQDGKWAFFTAAPIRSPEGKIIGAIETLWDTTDNKKAEAERDIYTTELAALCSIYTALNTSLDLETRIKAVIQEVNNLLSTDIICMFIKKKDGRFYLKYSLPESCNFFEKYAKADNESIITETAERTKTLIFNDIPIISPKESLFLRHHGIKSLACVPITAKERNTSGVLLLCSRQENHFDEKNKDILELIGNRIGAAVENSKLSEQYIKSEEKYRSLFNNNPNPIFIIEKNTFNILDTNQRAETYYGYTREEILQKNFLDLGDKNDEEIIEGLKSVSNDKSLLFSKKRHFKKHGLPFYVNINVCYATYRNSDVLIATTTDVTESAEKETQLIQASKMTTLGLMAAGMAHEINQPLNVIQVCADFFKKKINKGESVNNEEFTMLANDISANVQRAAGIIKHMRDFARQSQGVKTKININDPIKDVFQVLGHQLKSHQVKTIFELEENLPYIMAEHNRLEQVFINLVTNAVDAMDEKCSLPENKKSEKILTVKSFIQNRRVAASVSDTGTGMPQEIIDKIFEPFFTTKATGKGTGLGVSISYGIIKDYEGIINIESKRGKGTTFIIEFPAVE